MILTMGDKCSSSSTVTKWINNFQRGNFEAQIKQGVKSLQRNQILNVLKETDRQTDTDRDQETSPYQPMWGI